MWGVKSRSSEPKFLFPGLHLAFSDEYITIALSMCILLPFLSQSYHEVLGSKEESKEEGSFQSTVCLGKNFLPVDRFLCLVVMYNPGLEGKKKNLCLYSYFSPWFTVWFWPNHLASLGLSVTQAELLLCVPGWSKGWKWRSRSGSQGPARWRWTVRRKLSVSERCWEMVQWRSQAGSLWKDDPSPLPHPYTVFPLTLELVP